MRVTEESQRSGGLRAFGVLWFGQAVSLIGTGMVRFGLGVWVIEQTGQATPFTLTLVFATLPGILLAPLAGVVVDRYDRRRVMLISDGLAALVTLVIAAALLLGELALWHIYLLVFTSAAFSAFQEPAMTASIVTLVPEDKLGRASGMMSLIPAAGGLIAPVLAGGLYGFIGLAGIFALDLLTFVVAVITQLIVRIPAPEHSAAGTEAGGSFWRNLRSGFDFILARPALAWMLAYFSLVNFMAGLAVVLVPPMVLAFADERTLGIVQSVQGVGMLAGSMVMSTWDGFTRKMRGVLIFIGLYGASFLITALRPDTVLIAVGLFVMAINQPLAAGHAQPLWQVLIPQDMQGRVFSVRNLFSRALMPVAYLLAGPLVDDVFGPLMVTEPSLLTALVGSGTGRGAALIFMLSGVAIVILTLGATRVPAFKTVK